MYRRNNACSREKNIYKFVSSKMDAVYTVNSCLNFDICFHFEYSPTVLTYIPYPQKFHYRFNSHLSEYTPSFKVTNQFDDVQFIEVNKASRIRQSKFKEKFAAIKSEVSKSGCYLILVTENQIRTKPLLANLKLVNRYSNCILTLDLQIRILDIVGSFETIYVSELISLSSESAGLVKETVLSLVASSKLSINLNEVEFGFTSLVWRQS